MRLFISILLFSFSFGTILHVPGEGNLTIQEGINNASNGDILIIGRGLYEESLVLSLIPY